MKIPQWLLSRLAAEPPAEPRRAPAPRITGNCSRRDCRVAFDRAPGSAFTTLCTHHALEAQKCEPMKLVIEPKQPSRGERTQPPVDIKSRRRR